jgi:hypothetical protein
MLICIGVLIALLKACELLKKIAVLSDETAWPRDGQSPILDPDEGLV